MPSIPPTLHRAAMAWRNDDPDPATRTELDRLLARREDAEVADRFSQTLEFGTAGLRGKLGAGPNRMNVAMVARTTAGLCAWLQQQVPDATARGICIGFDGRRMSREFAAEAAAIAAGAGFVTRMFIDVVPTPVLAFAVLDRGAAAGIMITASHNPPEYNGYKVYWGNGAQIIPPHDTGIASCMAAIASVLDLPRRTQSSAVEANLCDVLGAETIDRYFSAIAAQRLHGEAPRNVRFAYTALHGVGDRFARRALREAGFNQYFTVAEQAEPDGAFPTVRFPNPEEVGAMDRVLGLAQLENVDVVLANDPDADRLCVAVRTPEGRYRVLTGNELGCLVAHYTLSEGAHDAKRLVVSSIVSSPMLGAIARAHGVQWEQTLTGFKWIASVAMEREKTDGLRFVFGYEEALGYTVGTAVRDKDGIGALALVADAAAWCAGRQTTLLDELEVMARRYGLFLSRQISVTTTGTPGPLGAPSVVDAIRGAPPERLAGRAVIAVWDLARQEKRMADGRVEPLALPASNVIAIELERDARVMARPSGTEPKIKYYFDLGVPVAPEERLEKARARGATELEALVHEFEAYLTQRVASGPAQTP